MNHAPPLQGGREGASRIPVWSDFREHRWGSCHERPGREGVRRKVLAYHRYLQIGCIAQGLLLHLSLNYTTEVWHAFRSWLRTMNPGLPPSELVVAHALRSGIPGFFASRLLEPGMKKFLRPFLDTAGALALGERAA